MSTYSESSDLDGNDDHELQSCFPNLYLDGNHDLQSSLPKLNVTIHLPPHGPKVLSVSLSQSIQSVKGELEKICGDKESLAGYDLVTRARLSDDVAPSSAPSPSPESELVVLNADLTIEDYFELIEQPIYVVPSQVSIRIRRSLDPSNSMYPPLEFILTSRHSTVSYLKALIFRTLRVPPQFQRLVCGGRELNDEMAMLPKISKEPQSGASEEFIEIELIVDPRFQSNVSRAKHRDPVLGLRYMRPVRHNGGLFCKGIAQRWAAERIAGGVYGFKKIPVDAVFEEATEFDSEIMEDLENGELSPILNIDLLATVYAILEPVKQFLSDVPSSSPSAQAADQTKENSLAEFGVDRAPCLVTIGSENSAKSTLLARLTMLPMFPRDKLVCTTLPIVYQFRRGPRSIPQIEIISAGHVKSQQYTAMRRASSDIQRDMSRETRDEVVSDASAYMLIQMSYPTAPILDIIDLPGLLQFSESATSLLSHYINEHSLYLGVFPAGCEDETTQHTILTQMQSLFQSSDILKKQTIGVVTKLDLAGEEKAMEFGQLGTKSKEEVESLGYPPYPSGYVPTMACQNGENCSESEEPFLSLEEDAMTEIEFFKASGIAGGCNTLIETIATKHLNLLSGYLEKTVTRLEFEREKLKILDETLGCPAAHEYRLASARESVKEQFISTSSSLIANLLPVIEKLYEVQYLKPLSNELAQLLQPQTFDSRREIPDRLKSCRVKIWETVLRKFEADKSFWREQLRETLTKSSASSEFKVERFPETEVLVEYSVSLVGECHQHIAESLENFLKLHFDQPTGLIHAAPAASIPTTVPAASVPATSPAASAPAASVPATATAAPGSPQSGSFVLSFSSKLVHLIVQLASATLFSFTPSNFATDSIRELLKDLPFLEKQRGERYELQQKLCLLDIALADLKSLREGSGTHVL